MSKTVTFLKGLSDKELASFAFYKLNSYLPETQKEIKHYLKSRGIDETRMNQLVQEEFSNNSKSKKLICPKCSSDKLRIESVEWTNTTGRIDYQDEIAALNGLQNKVAYKKQIICNVCGYWLKDPNQEKPKSWINKIWNYLWEVISGILSS